MAEQNDKGRTGSISDDVGGPRRSHTSGSDSGMTGDIGGTTHGVSVDNDINMEIRGDYNYDYDLGFMESLFSDKTAYTYLKDLFELFDKQQDEIIYELWPPLLRYFEQNHQYANRVKEILNIDHKYLSADELVKQSLDNSNNNKLQTLLPELKYLNEIRFYYDNKILTFHNLRFKLATYLYRATTTKELDSMKKFLLIGLGGGKFNFRSMTTSREISLEYLQGNLKNNLKNTPNSNSIGVIIKWKKNIMAKHLTYQGYASFPSKYTVNELLTRPNYIEFAYEEEYRLMDGVLDFISTRPTIIFIDINDKNMRKHLKAEYGSLGTIEFVSEAEFLDGRQ